METYDDIPRFVDIFQIVTTEEQLENVLSAVLYITKSHLVTEELCVRSVLEQPEPEPVQQQDTSEDKYFPQLSEIREEENSGEQFSDEDDPKYDQPRKGFNLGMIGSGSGFIAPANPLGDSVDDDVMLVKEVVNLGICEPEKEDEVKSEVQFSVKGVLVSKDVLDGNDVLEDKDVLDGKYVLDGNDVLDDKDVLNSSLGEIIVETSKIHISSAVPDKDDKLIDPELSVASTEYITSGESPDNKVGNDANINAGDEIFGETEPAVLGFLILDKNGDKFTVRNGCTIGRHESCEIVLENNTVSRRHASILLSNDGRTVIKSVSEKKGIQVNKVGFGVGAERVLEQDDGIKIGKELLTWKALPRKVYI